MSDDPCPLLTRIFACTEQQCASNDVCNEISPGKAAFLRSEFPVQRTSRIRLDADDISCLRYHEWLNDEVVNSYISILASQSSDLIGFTDSFFTKKVERDGYEAAFCWKGVKGRAINRYNAFIVPICTGVHWILACFDFVHERLMVMDSFHGKHESTANLLNGFLEAQGVEPLQVYYPEVPSQLNGYDCGVFILKLCECLFAGVDLMSFTQADIPNARKHIRRELIDAMRA